MDGLARERPLSPWERDRVRGALLPCILSVMSRIETSRQLRRRSTDVERLLWSKMRDRQLAGAKFRRQHPIGPYIVDFLCLEQRLVIELDGGQHAHRSRQDADRDQWLELRGYRVLRFWNNDAMRNVEGVLQRISEVLERDADSEP